MHESCQSVYRGCLITVSASEVPLSMGAEWFRASFAVIPDDPERDSWQAFVSSQFATADAAEANAMRQACVAIDLGTHGLHGADIRVDY